MVMEFLRMRAVDAWRTRGQGGREQREAARTRPANAQGNRGLERRWVDLIGSHEATCSTSWWRRAGTDCGRGWVRHRAAGCGVHWAAYLDAHLGVYLGERGARGQRRWGWEGEWGWMNCADATGRVRGDDIMTGRGSGARPASLGRFSRSEARSRGSPTSSRLAAPTASPTP